MPAMNTFILQTALLLYGVTAEFRSVVEPAMTIAVEGMSVQLLCNVSLTSHEGQTYAIRWKHTNSHTLSEETQSKYDIENTNFDRHNGMLGSTLTILNVTREDEGLYRCFLFLYSGSELSSGNYANVTIIPKPIFIGQPQNISVIEGQNATLRCRIRGLDVNTMLVKWTKGVSEVVISDINKTGMEESEQDVQYPIIRNNVTSFHLQIRTVRRSDAGMFYCSVHNKISGQVILESRRAMLAVLYPPSEDYPLCIPRKSEKYSEGDILTTTCISRGGNGPIYLSWLRNGEEIKGKLGTHVSNENPDIRHMWTLTAADNGANITCVMTGEAVLSRRECVIGPLDVYYGPLVSIEPKVTRMYISKPVRFRCSAKANPPNTIYSWFLNEKRLPYSKATLTINSEDIKKHITSKMTTINVTCSVDGVNSRVSDTAIVNTQELVFQVQTTISPELRNGFSATIPFPVVVVLSLILLSLLGMVSLICLLQNRGQRDGESNAAKYRSHTVPYEFAHFDVREAVFEEQTLRMDNCVAERSMSTELDDSSRYDSDEDSTTKKYEQTANEHENTSHEYGNTSLNYGNTDHGSEDTAHAYENRPLAYDNTANKYDNTANKYDNTAHTYENVPPAYGTAADKYDESDSEYESTPTGYGNTSGEYENTANEYDDKTHAYENTPPAYENTAHMFGGAVKEYENTALFYGGTVNEYENISERQIDNHCHTWYA
ncbi:neural cell adhesion molecule 1-A-like [Ptychodera flava]|uniref:neural cell adhesion molecule 1-A-like n=1 Tax=Ptychodera flava TaxID=63121 RepID=UPI00396A6096